MVGVAMRRLLGMGALLLISALTMGWLHGKVSSGVLTGPCDIMAAAGTPCVAGHGVTRRVLRSFAGSIFQIQRASDSAPLNVGTSSTTGIVNTSGVAAFCASTTCNYSIIYDQMNTPSVGNNLPQSNPSWQAPYGTETFPGGHTLPIIAHSDGPPNQYYRNRSSTVNIPTGASATTEYMVIKSDWNAWNGIGTYGNMENPVAFNAAGHMFALAWGVNVASTWDATAPLGTGGGLIGAQSIPAAGIDWEAGVLLYLASGTPPTYMTIMGKYDPTINGPVGDFDVRQGDATLPTITSLCGGDCGHPNSYPVPPDFEGGLSLGEGGDGSASKGKFFEGVVAASALSDATINSVQANIAAFYGAQ